MRYMKIIIFSHYITLFQVQIKNVRRDNESAQKQQKLNTQDRHYHVRCGTIFKDCDLD